MLNVALGGTLHQHLGTGRSISHLERLRRSEPVHNVALDSGSLLAGLCGLNRFGVNSIHHQGIDRIAGALHSVGVAEDGVVEVLESADRSMLAVQWHPESIPTLSVSQALFVWLIGRAREFASASRA